MGTPLVLHIEGLVERRGVGCREVPAGYLGSCHTDYVLGPKTFERCDRYEAVRVPPRVVLARRMDRFGSVGETAGEAHFETAPLNSQDRSFVVESGQPTIAAAILAEYTRLLRGNPELVSNVARHNKMPTHVLLETLDGTAPQTIAAADALYAFALPAARVEHPLIGGGTLCIGDACAPLSNVAAEAIMDAARKLLVLEE